VRKGKDAFLKPFVARSGQLVWQTQCYNSFLLGLDWRHSARLQAVRETKKTVDQQLKSLGIPDKQISELEVSRARAQARLAKMQADLSAFTVLPAYRDVETRANALTAVMHRLADDITYQVRMQALCEERLGQEQLPASEDLEVVYQQAGVIFNDGVKRSLTDVAAFHDAVTGNRELFLRGEVTRIRESVERFRRELAESDTERRGLLALLSGTGALDEFTALQNEVGKASGEIAFIEERLAALQQLRRAKADAQIEQDSIFREASLDFFERTPLWSRVAQIFGSHTERLYGTFGKLLVDVENTGPKFDVDVPRKGSHGVGNMAIFAYDLAVSQAMMERGTGPGFLVHDSAIFDGVDERQRAAALLIARDVSEASGLQYLCSLNTDDIPTRDLPPNLVLGDYVALELTDRVEDGGLFGYRFD
jgi:uncharacterized protein YydD (DUF2326 family)